MGIWRTSPASGTDSPSRSRTDSSERYGSPCLMRSRNSVDVGTVRPLNTLGPPRTSTTYSLGVTISTSCQTALYHNATWQREISRERDQDIWPISGQFFAEHRVSTGPIRATGTRTCESQTPALRSPET